TGRPSPPVLGVAAAVSFVATPFVRRLAARVGAVDIPDDRKVHSEPTPRMGGLAMCAAVVAALAVAWTLPDFRELFRESSEPLGILGAATVLIIVGVIDDIRGMSAPTKLAGQLLAAGVLVLGGVQIFYFWLPGVGVLSLSGSLWRAQPSAASAVRPNLSSSPSQASSFRCCCRSSSLRSRWPTRDWPSCGACAAGGRCSTPTSNTSTTGCSTWHGVIGKPFW